MHASANPDLINGSFVWTYPGCPLRVLLSLRALERLRAQVPPPQASNAQSKPRPLGGLLIGLKKSKRGITNVVDFVPAPPLDPANSPFDFRPEWIGEVADRCPPDFKIVGYYRISSDDSIRLAPDDLKLIQQRFADPGAVFLVIAPSAQGATGGFFCWHDGALSTNCRLTFPFSADNLASGGWPIRNGSALGDRLSHWAGLILHPNLNFKLRPGPWTKAISATLLIALLATGGVLLKRSFAPHESPADPGSIVALHVERAGASFVLTWDPTAPQILASSGGSLEIHEGTKPTSLLSLTAEQLRLGTLSYGSYPYTDEAEFKLLISGAPPLESRARAGVPAAPPVSPSPDLVADLGTHRTRSERPRAVEEDYPPVVIPEPRARANPPVRANPPAAELLAPAVEPLPPAVGQSPAPPPAAAAATGARAFVPPAPNPGVAMSPPSVIVLEPPALGQLPRPSSWVGWKLANSLPLNETAPPPAEIQSSLVRKPLPVPERSPAQAIPGLLTITSDPSGAAVQINDVPAGTTPIALQMSPLGLGFTVTVTKSGFAKWTIQSVATDQPTSLHASLRAK